MKKIAIAAVAAAALLTAGSAQAWPYHGWGGGWGYGGGFGWGMGAAFATAMALQSPYAVAPVYGAPVAAPQMVCNAWGRCWPAPVYGYGYGYRGW